MRKILIAASAIALAGGVLSCTAARPSQDPARESDPVGARPGPSSATRPAEPPPARPAATHASLAAYPNAVVALTEARSGTTVAVEPDGRVLVATDASGRELWRVDVLAALAREVDGNALIRHISLDPQGRIDVVMGKADFAVVDMASGKVRYVGSD